MHDTLIRAVTQLAATLRAAIAGPQRIDLFEPIPVETRRHPAPHRPGPMQD